MKFTWIRSGKNWNRILGW